MMSTTKEELDNLAAVIKDSIDRMGLDVFKVGIRENSMVQKGGPMLQRDLTGDKNFDAFYYGHDKIDCLALKLLLDHLKEREQERRRLIVR